MNVMNRSDNLYPVKAPIADGIGKTISFPKSVTYFGRLTILPIYA